MGIWSKWRLIVFIVLRLAVLRLSILRLWILRLTILRVAILWLHILRHILWRHRRYCLLSKTLCQFGYLTSHFPIIHAFAPHQ